VSVVVITQLLEIVHHNMSNIPQMMNIVQHNSDVLNEPARNKTGV